MPEEVKIRVVQEAQGSALDDAKKDLQELKQEAAKPTSAAPMIAPAPAAPATTAEKVAKLRAEAAQQRGFAEQSAAKFGFHDVSAKSARASASALEREANRLERPANAEQKQQQSAERNAKAAALREERTAQKAAAAEARTVAQQAAAEKKAADAVAAQAAKERVAHEKIVTREQREQDAVTKARGTKLRRLGSAAANLAENSVGGSQFGGVTNALGGLGGAAGTAAAFAAVMAAAIGRAFLEQGVAEKIMGQRDTAARTSQSFQLGRLRSFEGSAGSAREEGMSAKEEIVKRSADRARLEEEAKVRWWKPSTWLGGLTGANQNPITENEQGIQLAMEKEAAAKKIQKDKFAQEGAREIGIQDALAKGDVNRARAIQDALSLYSEKNRLQRDGATAAEAESGAEAKVANIRRERAGQFGRFINSGTSAAASARIATMAAQQSGMGRDERTGELIGVVKAQHMEATNAWRFKDFTQRN